ncbi:hypothetical protein MesoLjLb_55600 [Mesorhizobium sp. L-8-3]|nr:hypothetical protein MesoLjLb_55600 [Mesorhizobium sp. L-8-3]
MPDTPPNRSQDTRDKRRLAPNLPLCVKHDETGTHYGYTQAECAQLHQSEE